MEQETLQASWRKFFGGVIKFHEVRRSQNLMKSYGDIYFVFIFN